MYRIIAIICVSLLAIQLRGQEKLTAGRGKVQTITTTKEWTSGGKKITFVESVETYDQQGNLVEEVAYNESKAVTKHNKYEYDATGRKIKEIQFKPDGKVDKTIQYSYSGDMKTTRTVFDEKGKVKSEKTYTYTYF